MGYFVEQHCGPCDGIGRDDNHRICLSCKGTGLEKVWITEELIAEERRKQEREMAEREIRLREAKEWSPIDALGAFLMVASGVTLLGHFIWHWPSFWCLIAFIPLMIILFTSKRYD